MRGALMKKTIINIAVIALASVTALSCYKQDDIYREYIVVGGHTYPAKAISLKAAPGHNRVVLSWDLPNDPSIRTAKVYWDNYTDSIAVDYADFPDGHVSVSVPGLEERSYTFDVVNFDEPGNRSLASELTARPLGISWLVTHTERRIYSCIMDGDDAIITMTRSTDEMVATKFMVRDLSGGWKEYEKTMGADETVIRIPGVMKGKRFKYTSSYKQEDAVEEIWNPNWTVSEMGVSYPLDGKDWDIKVTEGQTRTGYGPELIFDGLTEDTKSRYFSSSSTTNRNVFPKILAFDTKRDAGKEYAITQMTFYLNPTSANSRYLKDVVLYVGDSEFDVDDRLYAVNFGSPALQMGFDQESSVQTKVLAEPHAGRYLSLVFKNSRSTTGYIDLWELVPYGYVPDETD